VELGNGYFKATIGKITIGCKFTTAERAEKKAAKVFERACEVQALTLTDKQLNDALHAHTDEMENENNNEHLSKQLKSQLAHLATKII